MLHTESLRKHEKKKKDPGLPYRTMVNTSPYNDGGAGSIRGLVAKICMPCGQKKTNKQTKKQEQYCKKFNKGFKNEPCQKKKNLLKKTQLGEGQRFTE